MSTVGTHAAVTQPSATANRSAASTINAADGGTKQAITSDFETFLLMLTTQLQNQDPLNPIESQDFAVQLATFSGVEQQVLTNELLENLSGALGASGLSQLAGWVSMEALVDAPVAFYGSPVDVAIAPDPGSDAAVLVVRDSAGTEVARESVPLNAGTFAWVGTSSTGEPLADGLYTLELLSMSRGDVIGTQTVPHYARVTEARQGSNGVELVISGGTVVASENVTALREPSSPSE